MDPSPVRVIAYCCNILGFFFLAKSISVKTPKYVLHELLRFKVNKSKLFRKHISQKLESVIGFVFLFVGFALLIWLEVEGLSDLEERMHQTPPAGFTNWWLVIGVTLAVMLAIAVLLNRVTRYFSGKIYVEMARFMIEQHKYPLESDESLVLELGRIMKVRRHEEDTVESYAKRVREKMKVDAGPPPRPGQKLAY